MKSRKYEGKFDTCITHQAMVQNGSKIPHIPNWIDLIVHHHNPVALAPKRGNHEKSTQTF